MKTIIPTWIWPRQRALVNAALLVTLLILLAPTQAVYAASITVTTTTDDFGQFGDLDVDNNAAATDLILKVANGGVAAISQDVSPDDRVLHVLQGTVEVTGVTFTSGTEAGGHLT